MRWNWTAALAELAANKGITFGCQIASDFFSPSYLQLYQGNVKIVTPENDLKVWRLRSAPASYNFSGADRILAFASTNKIAVHGHTLIWGNGKYNPPWIRDLPHDKVAGFIDEFVGTIMGRYRGRIASRRTSTSRPASVSETCRPTSRDRSLSALRSGSKLSRGQSGRPGRCSGPE